MQFEKGWIMYLQCLNTVSVQVRVLLVQASSFNKWSSMPYVSVVMSHILSSLRKITTRSLSQLGEYSCYKGLYNWRARPLYILVGRLMNIRKGVLCWPCWPQRAGTTWYNQGNHIWAVWEWGISSLNPAIQHHTLSAALVAEGHKITSR